MTLTFGSLFAGIGGLDLGFERAGMQCNWQVEIDPWCTRILAKHWPNIRRWDDVRTFPPNDGTDWRVDVICGGFPCQDISYAGRGAGIEGERSGMFFEAIRVVQQLQPRIVVLENVAALLTRGLDRVLGELAEIGFNAEWHCIPACAVGAPHIRDRAFILADRAGERSNGRADSKFNKQGDISQQFGTSGRDVPNANIACASERRIQPRWQFMRASCVKTEMSRSGLNTNWIIEPELGRVVDGIPDRLDSLRGLGNAVVPQVAEWIGRQIVKTVAGGNNENQNDQSSA